MKKVFVILSVCSVLIFFGSCGKKGPEAENQSAQESKEEKSQKIEEKPMAAMQEITKQLKEQSEKQAGGEISVADEATLKLALRPVSGWEMQEPNYSKTSMGHLTVSDLDTEYTMNGKTIGVSIADMGTASSALNPVKAAIAMNISREDSEGYQRIFKYKGHKGIEEYHKLDKRSEITLLYKDRYVVTLNTESDLTVDDLKNFLPKLNLSKLK